MAWLVSNFKCPLCEWNTPVRHKKPGYFTDITVSNTCSMCMTSYLLKFIRPKRKDGEHCLMTYKFILVSPMGRQLMEEQNDKG